MAKNIKQHKAKTIEVYKQFGYLKAVKYLMEVAEIGILDSKTFVQVWSTDFTPDGTVRILKEEERVMLSKLLEGVTDGSLRNILRYTLFSNDRSVEEIIRYERPDYKDSDIQKLKETN